MLRILSSLLLLILTAAPMLAQEQATESAADIVAAERAAAPAETPPADAAQQPAQPSPEAAAAKQAFDAAVAEWNTLITNIKKHQEERATAEGDARAKLDQQVTDLRKQADALIGKIADAALAVFKADPKAYPEVNKTLLSIVQHHLAGDANGDGGDQYEKAKPLIKGLIDAGAAEHIPAVWLWAGLAAYATNDYDDAKKYFDKAADAQLLGEAPPVNDSQDPAFRIWQTATQFHKALPRVSKGWEKEKQIRVAEAKADDLPRVKLTTTQGDVVIELFENEAPQAVANFLTLVKQGFYEGVVFHRVLPGFMAQGGDPTGSGSGGPGYSIKCECFKPDYRHHFRGTLSMAHAGRDTGGSQFFLTFVPTDSLDGRHTAFGRVIEGMDVVAALKRVDPESPMRPTPDRIVKAEVLRDRGHEYKFEKLPGR